MASPSAFDNKLPDNVMIKLKSNIRNLFRCKRVCGVCMNNTSNLRLGSTIYSICCGENLKERSLMDIIGSLFGYEFLSLLATRYFCEHCIDIILKAYRMQEEIKFNHYMLQYYSNRLMEQTKMQLPADVQSIVFELDYPNGTKFENYHSNNNITRDEKDFTSEDDESCNEELCTQIKASDEFKCKEETNNMTIGKPITLEIGEIMAKIKDQITFKKLVKKEPDDSLISQEPINMGTQEVQSCQKSIKKQNKTTTGSNFISNANLSLKERFYKCYLCDSTFSGELELLKHSRKLCIEPNDIEINCSKVKIQKDNDIEKKEVCDLCGKIVASNYLKKHKKLHEKRQRKCPECNRYINKSSFKKHMDSHAGPPKPRDCPYCNYKTKYIEALDAHINKAHLNVRPYKCDKCGKQFHSKILQREHIRIHSRLKTEQCHLCGNQFAYKKSLILHMRLHTGYAPYKCHLCDKSFISASRRQVHVQSKHIGKTLQCDICSKKFSLRATLRVHIQRIHNKDKSTT